VLKVVNVDLNVDQNTYDHHTDYYEITQQRTLEDGSIADRLLVVRRGEPFDVTITFDRPFIDGKDGVKLVFDVGPSSRESKGTRVSMLLSDKDQPKQWGASTLGMQGDLLHIRVFTPPTCFVAKWLLHLDTVLCKSATESKTFRYTHKQPIYVIFNPWCPDDQVYLSDAHSRLEFVLNDHGRLYRGTGRQISCKPWNFGQFEDFVLDCCMSLLDQSGLNWQSRGNPVLIARKISAIVNSSDDDGILVGNWSGDYSGGTSPMAWVGSVAILGEFWKTKKPVKFGQCWVFSAVVTSVARALGLPARSVTNFSSAHDCDGSITIDCHWKPDGTPLEEYNQDSVWNFHVWNETWMSRPDLPSGYGGWQAIDATPQETSDGIYCAGPASVEALKNGLTHLPYDGAFIFAEVNADRVNWIQKPDGGWCNTKQAHSIGKFISTKAPGQDRRIDITQQYKFPEGSTQERTAVWRAIKEMGTRADIYEASDMTFDLVDHNDTMVGKPFDVKMKISNQSSEERTVKMTLTVQVVYYTGVVACVIKKEAHSVKCKPKADGEVKMKVTVNDYLNKLVDMCIIKMSCMARVVETNQFFCESDDFRLIKPDIMVKAPSVVKTDEAYEVEAAFTNPLNRSLTRCDFTIEGASVQKLLHFKHA
ncbi:hypothetical protein CAPTEDRAFT_122859, partial [Capitella teleta]